MGEIVGKELPANVMNYLRGGRIVIVATVDGDGKPNTAPFSWVVAKDNATIRLGVNQGVATLRNIRQNGLVSMTIAAPDVFVTVKGTAKILKDSVEEAPLPTAVVEISVEEVKDDTVIGRVSPGEERTLCTHRRRLLSDSTILSALLRA